jgi:hypothetical protein
MKLAKTVIILVLCAVVIFAVFYFSWPIYKKKFKDTEFSSENFYFSAPSPMKNIIPKSRQEIAEYLEKNIDNFVPFTSLGEQWIIKRLGFAGDENIYLEIEDGHNLLKILLSCKKQKEDFKCYNIARFEPDNFQWKVVQGNDPFASREILYYGKKVGKWELVGSSFEIIFFPISRDSLLGVQTTVDQGYLGWRREPISVLRHDIAADFNFDINRDKFKPIARDDEKGKIIYQVTFNDKSVWNVVLIQPVKKGEGGVWVIDKMDKIK